MGRDNVSLIQKIFPAFLEKPFIPLLSALYSFLTLQFIRSFVHSPKLEPQAILASLPKQLSLSLSPSVFLSPSLFLSYDN